MRGLAAIALGVVTGISTFAQTQSAVSVYTAEQAETGRALLQANKFGACTDCHGLTLIGRDSKGQPDEPPVSSLPENVQKTLRYGGVPQLVGPRFVEKWKLRSTKELSEGFPSRFDGALTREQQMSLMAYILQMNGASPGQVALTMDTDVVIGKLLSSPR